LAGDDPLGQARQVADDEPSTRDKARSGATRLSDHLAWRWSCSSAGAEALDTQHIVAFIEQSAAKVLADQSKTTRDEYASVNKHDDKFSVPVLRNSSYKRSFKAPYCARVYQDGLKSNILLAKNNILLFCLP
jgi:hypothetical protein